MFYDFFKSTAQKGREYSRWIDLTLNSHFEAVISEIYRTEVRCLSKSTFCLSTQIQKGTKRSNGPKTDFLCHPGHPSSENRAQNRAQTRDHKYANISTDLFQI